LRRQPGPGIWSSDTSRILRFLYRDGAPFRNPFIATTIQNPQIVMAVGEDIHFVKRAKSVTRIDQVEFLVWVGADRQNSLRNLTRLRGIPSKRFSNPTRSSILGGNKPRSYRILELFKSELKPI
jgi:hypothetical protein